MTAPVARILLRYLAMFLVTKGYLDAGIGQELATDPDILNFITLGLGVLISVATETWYALARRLGWSK